MQIKKKKKIIEFTINQFKDFQKKKLNILINETSGHGSKWIYSPKFH